MREIKFRAWDIQTESMRDVLVIDWVNELIDLSSGIIERRPHEVVLMQHTGLKDKNGVEIYEGDLIEFGCDGEKETREVRYYGHMGYPAFDMAVPPNAKHYFDGNALSWISECGEYYYYVIGNIHEQEA